MLFLLVLWNVDFQLYSPKIHCLPECSFFAFQWLFQFTTDSGFVGTRFGGEGVLHMHFSSFSTQSWH